MPIDLGQNAGVPNETPTILVPACNFLLKICYVTDYVNNWLPGAC